MIHLLQSKFSDVLYTKVIYFKDFFVEIFVFRLVTKPLHPPSTVMLR